MLQEHHLSTDADEKEEEHTCSSKKNFKNDEQLNKVTEKQVWNRIAIQIKSKGLDFYNIVTTITDKNKDPEK